MEPSGKPLRAAIFNALDKEQTPFQQAVADNLQAAIHVIWEHGLFFCHYPAEAECQREFMDNAVGSLGIFNALSYFLADHMAIHALSARLSEQAIAEWQEVALEAFKKTFESQLIIRAAEFNEQRKEQIQ